MSESTALRFQQAYDEARAAITGSLASVKDTYESIQRDHEGEIHRLDGEKKELAASLNEAQKKIEGLNSDVKNLETALAASKEHDASTQKTLEVLRTPGSFLLFSLRQNYHAHDDRNAWPPFSLSLRAFPKRRARCLRSLTTVTHLSFQLLRTRGKPPMRPPRRLPGRLPNTRLSRLRCGKNKMSIGHGATNFLTAADIHKSPIFM